MRSSDNHILIPEKLGRRTFRGAWSQPESSSGYRRVTLSEINHGNGLASLETWKLKKPDTPNPEKSTVSLRTPQPKRVRRGVKGISKDENKASASGVQTTNLKEPQDSFTNRHLTTNKSGMFTKDRSCKESTTKASHRISASATQPVEFTEPRVKSSNISASSNNNAAATDHRPRTRSGAKTCRQIPSISPRGSRRDSARRNPEASTLELDNVKSFHHKSSQLVGDLNDESLTWFSSNWKKLIVHCRRQAILSSDVRREGLWIWKTSKRRADLAAFELDLAHYVITREAFNQTAHMLRSSLRKRLLKIHIYGKEAPASDILFRAPWDNIVSRIVQGCQSIEFLMLRIIAVSEERGFYTEAYIHMRKTAKKLHPTSNDIHTIVHSGWLSIRYLSYARELLLRSGKASIVEKIHFLKIWALHTYRSRSMLGLERLSEQLLMCQKMITQSINKAALSDRTEERKPWKRHLFNTFFGRFNTLFNQIKEFRYEIREYDILSFHSAVEQANAGNVDEEHLNSLITQAFRMRAGTSSESYLLRYRSVPQSTGRRRSYT